MPMQYKTIPAPEQHIKQYKSFKGVDMSSGITEVDNSRSPYAPNMIADMTGFPEKRPGYKSILQTKFTGTINGIHILEMTDGITKFVVHAGTALYAFTLTGATITAGEITSIYTGANNAKSSAFVMNNKLYILDGTNYIVYNGTTAANVEDTAYIPTTTISSPPAGGGEKYETPNLLQPKRINRFLGTVSDTQYYLDTNDVESIDLIQTLKSDGTFETTSIPYTLVNSGEDSYAEFTTPPGVTPVTGIDNIYITFTKTISGYADMIKKCTISTFYGIMSDNRIFVSGNPNYRNRDWKSELSNPEYFPDDGYAIVGSENSSIMGYLKQYDALMVVKEDSDQDATQYIRTAAISDTGVITYPLKQGLVGVGAVSKHSFGVLADDPLFLSKNGVYGIESTSITYQRTTQLRSWFINTALRKEGNLDQAVSAVWNGWYCLFINGKGYIANSQQPNTNKQGKMGYEWYYWTNVPVVCAKSYNGKLYFGTADGDICVFMSYAEDGDATYYDRGAPITARWSTKMDDYGNFMTYKTIMRLGCGILAKPYVSSSGKIYFANENDMKLEVKTYASLDTFSFKTINFAKFSFNAATNPRVIPINKRFRNTKLLQIIVENSEGGQGFGIYGIQTRFTYTKDVKK
jgi:hypothetical protein